MGKYMTVDIGQVATLTGLYYLSHVAAEDVKGVASSYFVSISTENGTYVRWSWRRRPWSAVCRASDGATIASAASPRRVAIRRGCRP